MGWVSLALNPTYELDVTVDFIFGFNAMVNHNWIVDKSNHRLLLL
jgi:hypothetical protein